MEADELPTIAMVREACEEVGITVKVENLKLVHAMYRTKHDATGDRADYFFETHVFTGEPRNMEPEKCSEVAWFPLDALPKNMMHHVAEALRDIQNGIFYSEITREKIHQNPNTLSS